MNTTYQLLGYTVTFLATVAFAGYTHQVLVMRGEEHLATDWVRSDETAGIGFAQHALDKHVFGRWA